MNQKSLRSDPFQMIRLRKKNKIRICLIQQIRESDAGGSGSGVKKSLREDLLKITGSASSASARYKCYVW